MTVCRACGTGADPAARFCSQCGGRLDAGPAIAPDLRERVLTSLRAEHRLVTVVFADMTGSVRRTRDLDAEEATTLVNPLLETMVELMVQHGGRIDRFLGDGVLAVFGVPSAHEDDPIRAVRASIGLKERAAEIGLEVTVGVNTGRVYFGPVGSSLHEELTVMGPVVNLAARLQGAADAGEVLVGSATREHVHAAFDLTPRAVAIKGMDQPVEAYLVDRPAADPDKVRGIEGLTSHLVGRDAELARLVSALEDRTSTVAIVGDAGLGKSRLAKELRSVCGRTWIGGSCQALSSETPFSGFVDLVGRHLPGDAEAIATALSSLPGSSDGDVGEIAPFLAHLVGRPFGDDRDLVVTEADAPLRRRLTIDAIVRWLGLMASPSPIVLFVDDLHWADPLTVEAVARIHGSSPDVLTVVASRPEPAEPLTRLASVIDVAELQLEALSDQETVEMVRRLLTVSGLPAETESMLVDRARGNPFYAEELIRSLIQRGMISFHGGEWVRGPEPVRLQLPESIDGLVMSRFDRLGSATRRAGQIASVLDRPFTRRLFVAVAGEGLAGSLDALRESEFLDLIDGDFAFTHDLIREAVYSSLLPSQKLELHHLVAETIVRLDPGDHESIAFHYERSDDDTAAVEHLHRAAAKALEAYANETAASYVERGIERIGRLDIDDRDFWTAAYLTVRAAIRERATDYEAALSDLLAARKLVPSMGEQAAEILRAIGRVQHMSGRFAEAFDAFDAAEEILDPATDPEAWIALQADRAKALYFGGRGRELPELIDRVEPVVASHGTVAQRADVLGLAALHGFVADRFRMSDATVAYCREALRLSETGADPGRLAEARFRLGFCLLWADRMGQAVPLLERALVDARRVGDAMLEVRAASYLAIALRRTGESEQAREAAAVALEIAEQIGDSYYMGHAEAVLGWAHWRLGDVEAAARHLRAALERWGRLQRGGVEGADSEFAWLAAWPLCAIAVEGGDHIDAAEQLSRVDVPWERVVSEPLAEAVARARERPTAETLERALHLAAAEALL